ncbi:MAG: 4Fe-4S binding protein [Coriobacteriales bacterium]|jgi:ferredoxin-type protein NapH|nr:4Fe-4S binding protein [Coriobacteriales bacterium]
MKSLSAKSFRTITITAVVLVVMIGYVTRSELGNLSALGWGLITAICPLGFLETMLASKTLIPQALISFIVIVIVVIVFGKFFCAWICPTALIQRILPKRSKKKETANISEAADYADDCGTNSNVVNKQLHLAEACKGKHKNIKLDSRHMVLGGTLLSSALFGFPVFCLVCPVGLSFATLLVIMRLFTNGEATFTVLLFPAILILELIVFRKWCTKICPLGACVSLLSGLNRFFRPHIDDNKCLVTAENKECYRCSKACNVEKINLRFPSKSGGSMNDCSKCRECSDSCPTNAIKFPFLPKNLEREKPVLPTKHFSTKNE